MHISSRKIKSKKVFSSSCHQRGRRHSNYSHGHWVNGKPSPTYNTWENMKRRCLSQKHHSYKNYGGRGITVCDKWLSFKGFLEDMGVRPEGKSLDRIDNDKGYYKENCRWADWKTQGQNKSTTKFITFNNETHCIAEWARRLNIDEKVIYNRLKNKLPISKALLINRRKARLNRSDVLQIRKSTKKVSEIASSFNVALSTIYRIKKKQSWRYI